MNNLWPYLTGLATMFDSHAAEEFTSIASPDDRMSRPTALAQTSIEDLIKGLKLQRRIMHPKQHVFRAGQPQQ